MLARCGKYRRVVAIAGLGDLVEEPWSGLSDGKSGSSVTEYGLASDVFQDGFALADILEKRVRSHGVDQAMRVAVGSDLVATSMGLAHKMRKAFCDVSQKEAGNARVLFAEDIEKFPEVSLHTGWQRIPLRNIRCRRQIQDVKPIFHINRKNASHITGLFFPPSQAA